MSAERDPRWLAYEMGYQQGASDGSGDGFGLGKDTPAEVLAACPLPPLIALTVANIRRALEQAISAVERAPAPVLNVCDCILCLGRQAHPPARLGEGPPVYNLEGLERRVAHLERPVADRDAIAWEIGRSAGIRGDAESLNPFRRAAR